MFALITKLVVTVGTFGSLAALAVSLHAPGTALSDWEKGWIAAAILLGVVAVGVEIREYLRGSTRVMRKSRVPRFMLRWINGGGRVAIFSRDLSWATEPSIKQCLLKKAAEDELTLVVPKMTALPQELGEAGATVITYPTIDYVIRSRFTIVNFEAAGSRVAIGMSAGEHRHRIEVIDPSAHPAYYMAQDLVELLRRFQEERESAHG